MKPKPPMRDGDALRIWTLYENPSDFPGMFVLRECAVMPGGELRHLCAWSSSRPEPLRERMQALGLVRLVRSPNDEPHIVETWI